MMKQRLPATSGAAIPRQIVIGFMLSCHVGRTFPSCMFLNNAGW
jgi:hypothetical protein